MRKIGVRDRTLYLEMAREFYQTDAVSHPVPEAYFVRTYDELLRGSPYAEGYILECDGQDAGYALLARSFSQEAGGPVVWVDELYVRPQFRGRGVGKRFLAGLTELVGPQVRRLRLEVSPGNTRAARLYAGFGFAPLEYRQMVREQGPEPDQQTQGGE